MKFCNLIKVFNKLNFFDKELKNVFDYILN